MKKFLLAWVGLFALGVVAPADAADLPPLPYGKAPIAPVPVYDWTGVYLGINGGGGLAHTSWEIVSLLGVAAPAPVSEGNHNASGGTAGGQFGYRWQRSHWVFGLEAQGNWADFKGSNPSLFLPPLTNQTKIDAFGLFTGQLGYAVNSLLFYGKTGAAVVHDEFTTLAPSATFNSVSETRWGYTLGVGVEYGFAENWSVGGEYDHLFLAHHGTSIATAAGLFPRTDRIGQDVDIGLIRVNYRWGGSVIAKY